MTFLSLQGPRVCFTSVLPLEMYYAKTDGKIIGKKKILRRSG